MMASIIFGDSATRTESLADSLDMEEVKLMRSKMEECATILAGRKEDARKFGVQIKEVEPCAFILDDLRSSPILFMRYVRTTYSADSAIQIREHTEITKVTEHMLDDDYTCHTRNVAFVQRYAKDD